MISTLILHTNSILFADDTTLYYSHKNLKYLKWCIEEDLKSLQDWFNSNKLTLNLSKTVTMLFHRNKSKTAQKINLKVGSVNIPQVSETKFLGIWIDNTLSWSKHLSILERKIKQNRHLLKNAKNLINCSTKRLVYFSHIYSHLLLYPNMGEWSKWCQYSKTTIPSKLLCQINKENVN